MAAPDPARVLALVPARGGSKGLPGKNLRPLAGHPLVAWAVAAGRAAASVGRVLVSTDDPAIRAAAVAAGAEAPFLRPPELAGDDTTDLPVFLHALDWLRDHEDYVPEVVVQLRPTSPLRPPGLVDAAVAALLADPEATAARTVTPSPQTPYKMWRVEGARLAPLLAAPEGVEEPFNAPRQRLPRTFWQTGHVDAARTATLRSGSMTGGRIAPVEVDAAYAVDIDTPADLLHAERLLAEGLPVVRPGPAFDLASVRLVVFDFDGVMTDNRVLVDEDGREAVVCDRGDGHGVTMLREAGVAMAVLSTEENAVVAARCRKLRLPCRHGLGDAKGAALAALAAERGVPLAAVAYVGNDVNDLDCLRMAGLPVVPADAHPAARAAARWVLARPGGRGAVRELAEALLAAR
jgi:YrbI family 3-deoxy-D-manno-octulosonate 8-phosphate phosphatase